MPAQIPILPSVAVVASRYDAWLVDVWGVMHNGVSAFVQACRATARFRDGGGVVVLISNAPRPFAAVRGQFSALGIEAAAYDAAVTSGDVARDLIAARHGEAVLHIGPDRDKGLFTGISVRFAPAGSADVVVCSGLYDDEHETPADYARLFAALLARRVPMICANPDHRVERGDRLVYCAGALAAAYAAQGGEVVYAGKPHAPIYRRALETIDHFAGRRVARQRVLAIGDGVETDLLGAHRAGLASLYVASSVHLKGKLDPSALARIFAGQPFSPVGALDALVW
jgi:HAD superfamily hydrolase (TIGR01459 family)